MKDFDGIFRTYFEDVRRYALRLCRDESKADELTADVFFRAMNSLDRFRGDCSVYSWLCQIAKNLWTDRLRAECQECRGTVQASAHHWHQRSQRRHKLRDEHRASGK